MFTIIKYQSKNLIFTILKYNIQKLNLKIQDDIILVKNKKLLPVKVSIHIKIRCC